MGAVGYRSPAERHDGPPAGGLPSVEALATSPWMELSSPASSLLALFDEAAQREAQEILASLSLVGSLVKGVAVVSLAAAVGALGRFLIDDSVGPVAVGAVVVGFVYGVVTVVRANVRFVDKSTRADVTFLAPFSIAFAIAAVGTLLEIGLSYLPVPSVIPAAAIAVLTGGLWLARYRPRFTMRGKIPHLATTRTALGQLDGGAPARVRWNDRKALPPDGLVLEIAGALAQGTLLTAAIYARPAGDVVQVVCEFPPSWTWRYPQPSVAMGGITLEVMRRADAIAVRAVSTHARFEIKVVQQALSLATHACTMG